MDKNITKLFKDQVWGRSLANAKKTFDSEGERMKRFFQLALWGLLVGFFGGAAYFGLTGNSDAAKFFFGLFVTDILTIFGIRIYIPLLAYFQMWDVAAERDKEQQEEIKEQQELIKREKKEREDLQAYYKNLERLGRGDLIELKDIRDKNWVGVVIANGEMDNPFNGRLYITNVTNHSISQPIPLDNWSGRDLHILPNGNKETTKLAYWVENENAIIIYPQNAGISFIKSGEYFIETMLEGRFAQGSYDLVYKPNKWKLVFEKEKKFFDLRKVE